MMNKLVWNQFNLSLIQKLQQCRIEGKFCDTTIVCEEKHFQLHKIILSNSSDYFEDIFNKIQCRHPIIVLKDIDSEDFQFVLDFIYKGEVDMRQSHLNKFLDIAKGLKIKGINTATVMVTDKFYENDTPDKMCDEAASNDQDLVDIASKANRPKKKKRKLHESFTSDTDKENDVEVVLDFLNNKKKRYNNCIKNFEPTNSNDVEHSPEMLDFLHTIGRNKKKKYEDDCIKNCKRNSIENSPVRGQHSRDFKVEMEEEEEETFDEVVVKDESFSFDFGFESHSSSKHLSDLEDNLGPCEVPLEDEVEETKTLFAAKDVKKVLRDKRKKDSAPRKIGSENHLVLHSDHSNHSFI